MDVYGRMCGLLVFTIDKHFHRLRIRLSMLIDRFSRVEGLRVRFPLMTNLYDDHNC